MSTLSLVLIAIAGTGLTLLVLICCGALIEVFQQLEQVRTTIKLDDKPIPLELRSGGTSVTDLGLPSALVDIPEMILIFLSSKCVTCKSIAHAFRGGAPERVWFILETDEDGRKELSDVLSATESRIVWDKSGEIATVAGIDITPSVLTLSYGTIVRAYAVSSAHQVFALIPTVLPAAILQANGREPAMATSTS
jgi:hypothetical protein